MVDYTVNDYHRKRHPEFFENPDLRRAWADFSDRVYLSHVAAHQRVLEFGGGLGNNLLSVMKRAEVFMVEPGEEARQMAAADGIKAVARLEELPAELRFDTILCRHVLEHVENPHQTLCDLRDRLSPDGKLVLIVPCENWDMPPDPNDLNHHLYAWSPCTLGNLLASTGFKVLLWRFEYYGARRKLLPLWRRFGGDAYTRAVRLVGRIGRFRELRFDAVRGSSDT